MAQLSDTRGMRLGATKSAGSDAVRGLAQNSPYGAGSRRAIVVDQDSVFGLSRMFGALVVEGSSEIEVFRDMEAACGWLGLDASDWAP